MQLRRSFAVTASALLLASPLLSACGFGLATDKVYTPANGANNRDYDVRVLAAVVVAAQDDSGTFIATLSNDDPTDAATFTGITGDDDSDALKPADADPVEIPAQGFVNLADSDAAFTVTGTFRAGDFVSVLLNFDNGDAIPLKIPVVKACGPYLDLDTSSSSTTDTTDEDSESDSTAGSAYSCEFPTADNTPTEEGE